jgi:hypothetical protein
MKNLQRLSPMLKENTKRRGTLEGRQQERRLLKPQIKEPLEMQAKMLQVVVDWMIYFHALIFQNRSMQS